MKVYFAGPITEGDWRFSFMKPEHLLITTEYVHTFDKDEFYQWPVMRRAVFNTFDYIGPFLEEQGDGDAVRGFFSLLDGQDDGEGELLRGVAEADCLVVYVAPDIRFDFAALEIGYAIAKKKPIFYVCAEGGWEAHRVAYRLIGEYASDLMLDSRDPGGDLRRMLMRSKFFFQSPLEKIFWQEASPLLPSLTPQYAIGPYYADFALPEVKLAIEIDGHEGHASKEQRTRDAKRDRFFMEHGWHVARFTGTEIFRDVRQCVQNVVRLSGTKE